MRILAVDPGPVNSAWVIWDGSEIVDFDKCENESLMMRVSNCFLYLEEGGGGLLKPCTMLCDGDEMVIEQLACYGKPIGRSILDTAFYSGRLADRWEVATGRIAHLLERRTVKMHLTGSAKTKDKDIRQALLNRFELGLTPRQRPQGMLKGISHDVWSALAVAVVFFDQNYGGTDG